MITKFHLTIKTEHLQNKEFLIEIHSGQERNQYGKTNHSHACIS